MAVLGGIRNRSALLMFSIGFSALIAVLYADVLFGGRVLSGRDVVPFLLPIEKAVHSAWSHGRVPLLMPEISFGRPLAANPNSGVFYPIRIALAAVPFSVAFRIFPLIHLALAGIGMFWLASGEGLSPAASTLAAISYGFSGPALTDTQFLNVLPGVALLPWVVGAASRVCRNPGGRSAALFSFLLALDLLAGDLFTSLLAVCGAFVWCLCISDRFWRPCAWLAGGAAVAGLIAGIQLLPAIAFTPLTVRGLGRFPLRAALNWSLSLWRLLELLVPFPFGNVARDRAVWAEGLWYGKSVGFYQTLWAGTLATLGIAMGGGSSRPHRRFVLMFGGGALGLAAFGFYLPARLLEGASPVPLRYPEKFAIGLTLAAALASACLWDDVGRRRWFGPAAAGTAIGLLLLGMALLAHADPGVVARFVNRRWSPIFSRGAAAARHLPSLAVSGAAAWLITGGVLFFLARGHRRLAAVFAAVLLAAELGSVGRSIVTVDRWSRLVSEPPSARAVQPEVRGGAFSFLPLQEYFTAPRSRDLLNAPMQPHPDVEFAYLSYFSGATFGIPEAFNSDYDISDFYRVELARREMERDDAAWSGVQAYVSAFSARAALVEAGRLPAGFPRPRRAIRPAWLVVNPQALPAVRFAGGVREVAGIGEAYDLIHRREVDLLRETVVESGRNGRRASAGGPIRVLEFSPWRVRCDVVSPEGGFLVIARAFSPFRDVLLDGRPAESVPADLCLTSVEIPAGRHRIELVETFPGGAAGPVTSLLGLAALGILGRGASRKTLV